MKSIITAAIAGLMLLGTMTAVITPKPKPTSVTVASDGGPMPLCYPDEPDCKPPIPTAR